MPTFQNLREFFDMRAHLNERGKLIVLPHWQVMWSAWGRQEKAGPIYMGPPSGKETRSQHDERLSRIQNFIDWQYADANIGNPPFIGSRYIEEERLRWENTSKHFDAFEFDDLVSPKTFDRHPQLAILASGGIDWAIALSWARNVLAYEPEDIALIYVDYGAENASKTDRVVNRSIEWAKRHASWIFRFTAKPPQRSTLISVDQMPGARKVYRNAFLASIGSLLAPNVWVLAGSAQDQRPKNASKSTRFFADISAVLSQQHGRPVQVNSPFRHLSKTELYGWFTRQHGDEAYQLFEQATDCDAKAAMACGKCRQCHKAAMTLVVTEDPLLCRICTAKYPAVQDNVAFRQYCFDHADPKQTKVLAKHFWPKDQNANNPNESPTLLHSF